jgi:sirohydrochlorin cobaltochelatase
MISSHNLAILLVVYGSLNEPARETYEQIRSAYQKEFPGSEVWLAFASRFIRQRLSENQGVFFHSPLAALAKLHDIGFQNMVVQSLQVVPGTEFHQLASLVHGLRNVQGKFGFENLEMGLPLLCGMDDCMKVSTALQPEFNATTIQEQVPEVPEHALDHELEAVVLMGHGTGHIADGVYSQMARVLERDYHNVFLGTLDGFPGIDEVLWQVKRSGAKRIKLMPFLLVAGGHALKDLAGDGDTSWKNTFDREGFHTEVYLKGLAENREILSIFFGHTRKAAGSLKDAEIPKD